LESFEKSKEKLQYPMNWNMQPLLPK